MSRRQERVGTMDGAYLMWTLDPSHAATTLDEYSDHFPNKLARQTCYEFMLLIDQVATEVQQEREERTRERARLTAK